MVWIPGGEFAMGSDASHDARPVHRVAVDGFWMDVTEVTNADWKRFTDATGYVTVAERVPRAEDYPGAQPENLVAGSVVFTPPSGPSRSTITSCGGATSRGADWRHPEGPGSSIDGRMDHPVVHVAWEDVQAYAKWAGEAAPHRGGVGVRRARRPRRQALRVGRRLPPDGAYMANTFQGHFPDKNTGEDGFLATSPVQAFPPNGYGLYGMAGNVWEWVSDWYRPDYYARLAASGGVAHNPKGPSDSMRPHRAGRREARAEGRLVPLHRPVLRALHAGWARQGRAGHRDQPHRLPVRARPGSGAGREVTRPQRVGDQEASGS